MAKNDQITKNDELEAKINTYLELAAQIKALQDDADAIKKYLTGIADATEARAIAIGAHSITIAERERSTINAKEFAADHPRLAAKYTKVTKYDVVTIK